jgi:hypothetical protein
MGVLEIRKEINKMRKLLLTALIISMASSIGTVGKGSMVLNGGFEEDMDGNGMADHWYFSGDQGVTVIWGLDEGFVGPFSQRITCTQFITLSPASHVIIAQRNTVQLQEGMWYKISFAAKQEEILSQVAQVAIVNMKTWLSSGLNEYFQVTDEWKRFEFVFQATETILESARLQFGYTSTGTLWLDDVRLEPSEPVVDRFTEIVPSTTAVNLLRNSSFECGISGWGSIADLPDWIGNLDVPVGKVDTTTSRFHRSSLKIALTPENMPVFHFDGWLYRMPVRDPLLANRGWITVEPGADYTLTAYMKASSHGLMGVLSAQQAFRGNLQMQVYLSTEWTRYRFVFQPQAEQIFIALGLDLKTQHKEAGTVWIDGVQLEKQFFESPYRVRTTVEVGLETARFGNLFPYGVEPEMVAKIFNSDLATHSIVLYVTTTDFDDAVVHETTLPVDVPPRQTVRIPIDPGVLSKGFYRLHLRCEGADVALTRSLRFAIIQPYTKSDSLFGMNHAYPWPHLLGLSRLIGINWFRDWSLQWQHVEPEEGRFEFTETDYQINRVLGRGLSVIGLLPFPSSNWSSSAGPEVNHPDYVGPRLTAYMPRDLEEFATYVRETVQHYKERLGVWEILNEPIYSQYALPQEKGYHVNDYVQLLQVAYQAVKVAEPSAIVIGGIGGPAHAEEFIEGGGLLSVDILNLHLIPGLRAPDAYEEPLRRLCERMRSVGANIPIWLTEGAYYADDDKPFEPWNSPWLKPVGSEIEASEWQVKLNTLLLTYGTEKIIYHSGTPSSLNNESLVGIFFEWAGEPRKMLVAQSAMANLLSPPIRSLGPIESPKELKAYGFESDGRTVIIAWAREGAGRREISLAGKPWQVVELQGNTLEVDRFSMTERPVYFVVEGTMPEELPW